MTTQTAANTVLDHLASQTAALESDSRYPAPDLQVIIQMRDKEFERFGRFHKQCAKVDEFYKGKVHISVPKTGEMVVVPTAHTEIETFADHIDVEDIQIDVRSGPRGQASAEIRAKFFQALAWRGKRQLRTAKRHLAMYGVAILKRWHDADRWPSRPEPPDEAAPSSEWTAYAEELKEFSRRRQIGFPIVDDVVNPQQCVWDLSRGTKRWLIEKYKMDATSVKKWAADWQPTGNGEVEITEYWDDQWMAVLADDFWLIRPRWHGYDILSYTVMEPAMGIDSQDAPPEDRYIGIITPAVQELITEESRLVSQYVTVVGIESWPVEAFQGPPQQATWARDNWDNTPGAKNILPPEVTLVKIDRGVTYQQILQVRNLIRQYIDDDTLPSVLRGAEPSNRSSGFETTARAGMARLRLSGAASAIAVGLENMNVIAAKLVENVIREPVTIFAQTPQGIIDQRVRPRDVAGQYFSRVSLEAASPQDRVERGLYGVKLKEAGLVSELMVRRDFLGQTNALEDMLQTQAEQLFKMPEFQQQVLQQGWGFLAAMLQQEGIIGESTGANGMDTGNQFTPGAGANAAFATTSQPDQTGRVMDRLQAIQPGGLQDIQNRLNQTGVIGGGPVNVPGRGRILPNGNAMRR